METFWFFRLRFRWAYDSTYDSDFRFSLGHKLSYDSDSDSDSVANENQPSGFRRQGCLSLQGTHLPIYAYLLWFLVSFAKLRHSGPVWNFLPFPPPLWRHVHLSPISVLSPSASAKSCFLWLSIAKVVSGCIDSENGRLKAVPISQNFYKTRNCSGCKMLLEVSEVAKKLPGNLWKALANCDVPFPKKI